MRTAVYPGSFDPVTKGHLDIIRRAGSLFDKVIVAVSNNPNKSHSFSVEERMRMLRSSAAGMKQVEVDSFSGLLVDYLKAKRARVVLRGLRAVSDMEYEFEMASMNRRLYPEVETVFLMPDERFTYLSSSTVREVASLGGKLEPFVTPSVVQQFRKKLKR